MKTRKLLFCIIGVLGFAAAARAAAVKVTYTQGVVTQAQSVVKSGRDSMFVLSFGAPGEIRCGSNSEIEAVKNSKSRDLVFSLKTGECFVRLINTGDGTTVVIRAGRSELRTQFGAFYINGRQGLIEAYDGVAGVKFGRQIMNMTRGHAEMNGKPSGFSADAASFRQWNFNRDKTDLFVQLDADSAKAEAVRNTLITGFSSGYACGNVSFNGGAEPQDLAVKIKITAADGKLAASGTISNGITNTAGIIDAAAQFDKTQEPYTYAGFTPFIYTVIAQVIKSVEQREADAMKKGRIVMIEANGASETASAGIEDFVSKLPGFMSEDQKNLYNQKAVFRIMYFGTGYDIAEGMRAGFKNKNINIWKYSKNIVKLDVLKVER
jgi:hypothetical protein